MPMKTLFPPNVPMKVILPDEIVSILTLILLLPLIQIPQLFQLQKN